MPAAPAPAQQQLSRANGARSHGPVTDGGKTRAVRNGSRHGLRGGDFRPLPGEDALELDLLRQAVAADWRPRDAYERHWASELVAAMWRQQRLRRLEFAALDAAEAEHPPSEASLKRLLTFARYGARIDGDLGRVLKALRSLKGRIQADLATPACTREPEPPPEPGTSPGARTPEPEPWRQAAANPAPPTLAGAVNRHERRRLDALTRKARPRAA